MSYHASGNRQIGVRRYRDGGHPEISVPESAQELGWHSPPAEIPELLTLGRQTALLTSHEEKPKQDAPTRSAHLHPDRQRSIITQET
jgi:hypothetical protein